MKEFKVKIQSQSRKAELIIITDNEYTAVVAALNQVDPNGPKLRPAGAKWLPVNKNQYQLQIPQYVGPYIKFFRTGEIYDVSV